MTRKTDRQTDRHDEEKDTSGQELGAGSWELEFEGQKHVIVHCQFSSSATTCAFACDFGTLEKKTEFSLLEHHEGWQGKEG